MGSGVFLAAVVVAWFLVLVPMILTRRDTAYEQALAEDDVSGSRVLSRSTARTVAHSRRRSLMSARESSPSHLPADDVDVAERRLDHDEIVDTAVHERIIDMESVDDAPHEDGSYDDAADDSDLDAPRAPREHRRTAVAREQMVTRRRNTLMTLSAVLVVMLALALFAGSWTWFLAVAAGLALGGYVVHLRAEARREEERRLTRAARANRPRERRERAGRGSQSAQSSLAGNAFLGAPASTAPEVVELDDEDLAFYDLADAPVADQVDLSGEGRPTDGRPDYYDYDDYEYDSEAYGIDGAQDEGDGDTGIPRAV